MLDPLRTAVLFLLSLAFLASAKKERPDFQVLSPSAGCTITDSLYDLSMGVSYSRYPKSRFGYGLALNLLANDPELEATARLMFLNVGLHAGPAVSRRGLGLTFGATAMLFVVGEEVKVYWIDNTVRYGATIFIPLWWQNGKFWDFGNYL